MTFKSHGIKRLLYACCASAAFSATAQACGTRDGCITAIMAAARAGDQVTLAFYINENGKPVGVRKVGSSGHIALDLAAMTGVVTCQFSAAVIDGKPAASWLALQYTWTLEQE
ncbi:TonB family protein [Pseudoduganella sp. LjRoot289]|uniref:energy transducer TonB n=1 Tax=Pseudoduganella sp. LjRoot289 TaxID=3342314 RepID=UPI003ECE2FCD